MLVRYLSVSRRCWNFEALLAGGGCEGVLRLMPAGVGSVVEALAAREETLSLAFFCGANEGACRFPRGARGVGGFSCKAGRAVFSKVFYDALCCLRSGFVFAEEKV